MKRTEAQFDKIESYLRGEMPSAEVADFERQIANDPDLEMEVEMQRLEHDAMEVLLEDKLRTNMKAWQQPPPPPAGGNRRWWMGGIAALVIVVSILIYLTGMGNQKEMQDRPSDPKPSETQRQVDIPQAGNEKEPSTPQNEIPTQNQENPPSSPLPNNDGQSSELLALATTSYELPEALQPDSNRGSESTEANPLDTAITAFEANNYRKVIQISEKIKPQSESYDRAQEILGSAYFLNKQYRQAAIVFQKMANYPTSPLTRQYGEWYLTLSLLPNYTTNKQKIDSLLEKMTQDAEHSYHPQALRLQDKLKGILR